MDYVSDLPWAGVPISSGQEPQRDLLFGGAARALYDFLLAPASAQLRGKTSLVIVPDETLCDLRETQSLNKHRPAGTRHQLRKAAGNGDAKAQYNLGRAYQDGEGVRLNHRYARLWLEKAARHGHRKARAALKNM